MNTDNILSRAELNKIGSAFDKRHASEDAYHVSCNTLKKEIELVIRAHKGADKKKMAKEIFAYLIEERGYEKNRRWITEVLRENGLQLRAPSKSNGRSNNGGNSTKEKVVLRGNAKKAFDYVSKLKLTDKQMVAFIAALNS